MEFLEHECSHHSLPINNICTYDGCENNYLCDYCLNIHEKDHKYIISVSSLSNNIYEKIIEKNQENSKTTELTINDITNEYIHKIEFDFQTFSEFLLNILQKSKNELIEKINNYRDNCLDECKIWRKLKFEYNKNFLECINKNNLSLSRIDSEPDSEICNLEDDELFGKKNSNSNKKNKSNDSFINLIKTINTVLEREITAKNKNEKEFSSLLIKDFISTIKNEINEDFSILKKNLIKISEEKIIFSNRMQHGKEKDKEPNIYQNCYLSANNTSPTSKDLIGLVKNNRLNNNINTFKKSPNIPNSSKHHSDKYDDNSLPFFNSPLEEINLVNKNMMYNSLTRFDNFDMKNFDLSPPEEIFNDKKGCWYSLEYIEDHDYVVCGFLSGEILIFKESDLTPVKTFRPRFKKIRKLLYSSENSSIFASYDDGYIVVIYLTNFKLEHFRMSDSQIYSMEILPNLNILIFGGVEKKIMYASVINLSKVLLFHDSKDGEIQSLLYDEKRDILISAFRKNTIMCFKYSNSEVIFRYEFEGQDCCGMVIKKFQENSFLVCGYFLKLYHFRFTKNNGVERVESYNLKFLHLYDIYCLSDSFLLLSTYDDGRIVLIDVENKKITKKYTGFNGAIQIKKIKNRFYITSHSECLKRSMIK